MSKVVAVIRKIFVVLSVVIAAAATIAHFPTVAFAETNETTKQTTLPADEWNDEVKLWLSRSVLGEAGWRRYDEFSAIAWVYVARAKQTERFNFLEMVKSYSAAVRSPGKRRNPWLFELDLSGKRPRSWPINSETKRGPLWKGLHEVAWQETLEWADEWQAGNRPNPCPDANHFGGWVDRHRAHAARWKEIKCSPGMRNKFYTSLKLVRKRG